MSSEDTIQTNSEVQTIAVAQDFAKTLNAGDVVCLYGTLGMGKSVFARAIIQTLCSDSNMDVPSPTFTLVQIYEPENAPAPIWHFDLYRLEDADEIYETGWEDALGNAIVLIEWPERLGPLKPRKSIDIHISAGDDNPNQRDFNIKRAM